MDNISLTCFTASYAIALLLEISRLFFRSGVRGAIMLLFAGAGLVAHSWYLVILAFKNPQGGVPLSSWYSLFLVAAWIMAAIYFYFTYHHARRSIGMFVLPIVLGLIGVAYAFSDVEAPATDDAMGLWLTVHVVSLLLGTVVVSIGFVAGVMYLVGAWQLKHKAPETGVRLPSLEWCEQVNRRSLSISTVCVAIGMGAGLLRNLDLLHINDPAGVAWGDPIVWSSALLLGWLTTAVVFRAIYRPARQGRKVAYLTVVSFLLLALVVAIMMLVPSTHSTATLPGESETSPRTAAQPEPRTAAHPKSHKAAQSNALPSGASSAEGGGA